MLTRFGRGPDGAWFATCVQVRPGMRSSRSVTQASFWQAVELVLVPSWVHVLRYKARERR